MKNLTKYHKIGLASIAIIAAYFAWKHFSKPEVMVVEEVTEIPEVAE